MLIFILGYMGSGKTTAGKKLAARLAFSFCDLDELFEHKHGTTVTAYFSVHGEAAFREQEKDLLASLLNRENLVVATGGGTPCFYDNMEQMNKHGITVYLDLEPQALFYRLTRAKTKRPLLQDYSGQGLLDKIREDLEKRSTYYLQARYIVSGEDLKYSRILELIDRHLSA